MTKFTEYTTSAFNSLVIGSTGYEAVKFLYEFGAFVKANDRRSDFHCTVIDENMEHLDGFFKIHTPAMKDNNEIELVSCLINSDEYWDKIKSIMPGLKYVVFSLGSNENTLNAVAYFCKMAAKWKGRSDNKNKGKVDILVLVRSYNNDNHEQLVKMCEEISNVYVNPNIQVKPFGSSKELFTYDIIVDNKTLAKAKEYNYHYNYGNNNAKDKEIEYDRCWNKTLGIKEENNPKYDIDELQEIKRKRETCISNYLHKRTKQKIIDECKDKLDKNRLLKILCLIEHERWMAYMKINGWTSMKHELVNDDNNGVDKVRKLHEAICPWNDMKEGQKEKVRKLVNIVFEDKEK